MNRFHFVLSILLIVNTSKAYWRRPTRNDEISRKSMEENELSASVTSDPDSSYSSSDEDFECNDVKRFKACYLSNCTWSKGSCVEKVTFRTYSPSATTTEPFTDNELTTFLASLWNTPPKSMKLDQWQGFIICTTGVGNAYIQDKLLLLVLICCCSKYGFKCCCRKCCGMKSKRLKRLVLVMPRGRRLPVGDFVIDSTGDAPRRVLISGPATNLRAPLENPLIVSCNNMTETNNSGGVPTFSQLSPLPEDCMSSDNVCQPCSNVSEVEPAGTQSFEMVAPSQNRKLKVVKEEDENKKHKETRFVIEKVDIEHEKEKEVNVLHAENDQEGEIKGAHNEGSSDDIRGKVVKIMNGQEMSKNRNEVLSD